MGPRAQQGGGRPDADRSADSPAFDEGSTPPAGRPGGAGPAQEPSSALGQNEPVDRGNPPGEQPDPNAAGSPVGNPGLGAALPSPIKVPLPTNEVTGRKFEEAVELLRKPIATACGAGQCVTVRRQLDTNFDAPLTTTTCDVVTSVVGAEGVGATQTVGVERGGSLLLGVSPDCSDVPKEQNAPREPEGDQPG